MSLGLSTVDKAALQKTDAAFKMAAEKHGDRFWLAYTSLLGLDPLHSRHRRTVRDIIDSADPAKALMDWHQARADG